MKESAYRVLLSGFLALCLGSCGSQSSADKSSPSPSSSVTSTLSGNFEGIQPAFFGLHIHHIGAGTPWPSVPFGTWDLWDSYVQWPNLEPNRGKWDFSRLDMYVAQAQQHHVDLIYTLGLTPQWASARPSEKCPYGLGEAAEPANLQDWRDYVRTVATRYKGKLHYYILWNEPNLPYFFTGSIETLVELSKEAYSILKSVDPTIEVLSPSGFRPSWMENFLAAGGGQYFDVVAAHLYTYPNPPERTVSYLQTATAVLQKYGMSNKPVWNTEIGWYRQSLSDPDAIAYVSRSMIINAASGIGRFVWYAWDNHGWAKIWLTQTDNVSLTPAGLAFAQVETWLTSRTIQCQTTDLSTGQLWTCLLTSVKTPDSHIVWTTSGSLDFQIPASWNVAIVRKPDGSSTSLNRSGEYTVGTIPVLFEEP